MKRINNNLKIGILCCCFLSVFHILIAQELNEYTVCSMNEPVLFEFDAASATYSFIANIRTDKVKSRDKWVFTPVITLTGNRDTVRYELKPIVAEGELHRNLRLRDEMLYGKELGSDDAAYLLPVKKDTLFQVPYEGIMDFHSGMQIEKVSFLIRVYNCCNFMDKPEIPVDFAFENTFLGIPFLPVTLKGDGITSENLKIRKVEGRAYLQFEINKAEINLSNPENDKQINEMTAAFRKILTDPYAHFDSAFIKGQSSPEGPFEFNNKLAIKRSESALKFLKEELNRLKIPYSDSQFDVSAIPEAWDELSEKIASSELDDKEKNIVLDIIRNTPIKAEREYKLRQRRNTFRYIKDEILGNIRRVDYAFYLTFKDLTLEEQIALLHTRPDIYSPSDFLAVVNYTNEYGSKLETLQIARKYYPENAEILATLMDLYLGKGDMEEAQLLVDSIDMKDMYMKSSIFLRNIAVFYMKTGQGDVLEKELYSLMFSEESLPQETKIEVDYFQGLLALQKKDFQEAYKLLAKAEDMNAVMALAGLGEYQEAWKIAENCECTNASELYLKAILAAYLTYEEDALDLLEEVLSKDSRFCSRMLTEYAFWPFRNNEAFKELVRKYN